MGPLDERKAAKDAILAVAEDRMAGLTQSLLDGKISIADWQIQMRQELRDVNALMLVAGAGGDRSKVDPSDWLKLGPELKSQYRYLENFAHELASGDPRVLATAVTRAKLYARSTQATFWRQALPVQLPAYPGDGSSECLTNCLCDWEIDYELDGSRVIAVLATWARNAKESCDTCIARSVDWKPLRIPVRDIGQFDTAYKLVG